MWHFVVENKKISIIQDPTYEQLNQLKYAEATMKEALRLHPIAAL